MTIHGKFNREVRLGLLTIFAGQVLMPIVWVVCALIEVPVLLNVSAGLIGAVSLGMVIVMLVRVRCPRCRTSLLSNFIQVCARGPRARYCPYCALDLDTPVDEPMVSKG